MLAELCRRDLVPELWLPSAEDRALRERLRRRAHLVKARTSARNRIFGLLTQFGLRIPHARLRKPDGMELLTRCCSSTRGTSSARLIVRIGIGFRSRSRFLANIARLYRGEPVEAREGSAVLMDQSFPEGRYVDVPGLCAVVTLDAIEEQGWSLNPGRYVGVAVAETTVLTSGRVSRT